MKRSALAIIVLLLSALGVRAQSGFTQVHAVVLDPTGQPYANCSGNASFVPSPSATQVPTIGGSVFPTTAVIASCDSFGAFSLKLADNNVVVDGHTSPPASQWNFAISAQGGTPGFSCVMTITGAAQDVSAQLQACAAPLPAQGGGNVFAFTVTPQSATPSFTGNQDTVFSFVLNKSVTSSTFITNAKAGTSPVYYINICQDAVGGWNMTWPSNVTLPSNYVFSTTANACSPVAFAYNPNTQTWSPWMNLNAGGGGGGGNPPFSNITGGTNNTASMTVGTGASINTNGSGTIAATSVPFSGVASGINTTLAGVCSTGCSITPSLSGIIQATALVNPITLANTPLTTAGDVMSTDGVNLTRVAGNSTATRKFLVSQSGVDIFDILGSSDIPAGSNCSVAGQYANGIGGSLVPNCAQVQYSQLGGVPSFFYQNLFVNGIAQTQRPNWNLINGANCTVANVDNNIANRSDISLTCTGGGGGSSVGSQGTGQIVGSTPGTFDAGHFTDIFGVFRVTETMQNCGPEPNSNIYCYGAFTTYSSTTGSITAGTNTLTTPGPASFRTGEYLMAVGVGATSSIGTPTSITITSVTNAGGDAAVTQTGGATAAGVCIVAVAKDNSASPCSAVATTSTGQASLGKQTATISSFTRNNNVVTVACSSPCLMPNGTSAYINYFGNSDQSLAGWFGITSIDSTHFTFNQNLDTRAGAPIAPTSLTSPTVTWFQMNRYQWAAVSGAKYYEVYGGTACVSAATCTLIGYADAGRLRYDDYGSTMEANKTFHPWTPTTGPTAARNGNLSCKIGAGGGTTTLTLVNPNGTNCNAGNTGTGVTVLSDDGPAIFAAAQAAGSVNGVGGPPVRIPSPPSCSGPCSQAFPVVNSYTDLSALGGFISNLTLELGTTQLLLNDTLVIPGGVNFYGSGGAGSNSFAWGTYPLVYTNGEAFPAIIVGSLTTGSGGTNIHHLNFRDNAANGGLFMYAVNMVNNTFCDLYWSTAPGGTADYKNMHALFLVTGNGASSFKNKFCNSTFITGIPGGASPSATLIGNSPVPSVLFEAQPTTALGDVKFTDIWTSARGSIDFEYETVLGGNNIKVSNFNMQDNYEPGIQISGTTGLSGLSGLTLDNLSCFDLPTACVWYYPQLGTGTSSSTATVTGPAFNNAGSYPFIGGGLNVILNGQSSGFSLSQNIDLENTDCSKSFLDGIFSTTLVNIISGGSCQKQLKESVQVGAGQNIFTPRLPVVGPTITCDTSSGTVPAGTYYFLVGLAEPMGGEGGQSQLSAPCTLATPGNILIDWSATAAASPGVAGWELYYETTLNGGKTVLTSAAVPGFPASTTSYSWTNGGVFHLGASPSLPGSGNNGFNNSGVYGSHVEAGFVPGKPCQTSLGVDVPGCIAQLQSNSVAQGAAGVQTSHYNTAGVQVCTNNGGPEAPCVSGGGGGGGTTNIVIPPNPVYSVLSPQIVYTTPSASVNANISATNMVAMTNTIHEYKFEWIVSLTTPGTSCVGSTTVVLNAIYTNPNNSTPVTQNISGTITLASSGNGTAGFIASGTTPVLAAPGTAVQYSTSSYTGGGSCSPNPKYQVQATLVQEF